MIPASHADAIDGASRVEVRTASEPNQSVLSFRWVRRLLLLGPLFLLVASWPFAMTTDYDYWWHVRTGQYIYQTHSIPSVDLFSYTAIGHPWVTHEWLTELIFYVVSSHVGYVGNVVLFGLISALTGLFVYATGRRWGVGELPAALLMLWSQAMALVSTNVRPQVLTAFLLAVCVYLLTRYKQGGGKALLPLPLIFALWVNLHAGYIVGLALLALTIAGELLAAQIHHRSAPLKPLLGVSALSAVATLLNPHLIEAWLYPFSYLGRGNASMRFIAEWQSPDFHKPMFLIFGVSIILIVFVGLNKRPLGPTEILWALAFTFLGLQSARHIPLFAVVVIPLLGARLQEMYPRVRTSLAEWRRPALLVVLSVAALLVTFSPMLSPSKRTTLQLGWEPRDTTYPSEAVAYLRTHRLSGNLFNEYNWGGYLIYELYPTQKVFIDGRIDVYGDALGETYDQVVSLSPGWQKVLDDYHVGVVLIPEGSALAAALDETPSWRAVYGDRLARVFVRDGG